MQAGVRVGGRGTVAGIAEEAVKNGGEGQANDCAEEEYGEEDLMKCELFVQREHLQDEGIHPRAAAASTSRQNAR